jgi:hypothetical protein
LAKRHRQEGPLALSDLTVLSCEGHTCPFAQLGHARDGPKGKGQRVFGRVCHAAGCPVAVEVFAGNTGDPPTVAPVSAKLRQRFHLRRVGLVGDRGLLTDARLREELKPVEGLDWMTALRHPTVRTLVDSGALARGGCAHTDLIALTAAASPDERLMACDKASLADERRRKREALLQATACERETIGQATTRAKRRLTGQAPMALRVGKVLNRFKMGARFLRRDTQVSIAYSEELIFPISATLQSTDRHHGIVGQERCHFQRDS